jgi:4-amino-4-deoxy-L-arabinose transferase-like glycosyltransferase
MVMENRRKHYIIIILIALLVRTGFMVWSWSSCYVRPPSTLSKTYFIQGYGIAAGYGYLRGDPVCLKLLDLYDRVSRDNTRFRPEMAGPLSINDTVPETLHPPGMALLIAGINILFGVKADVSIQVLSIILDTIAVALVYWLSAVLFNARIGFVAGLLYAIFPALARAPVAKDPDGLIGVFVIAGFCCFLQSTRTKGWSMWGWLAGSGLVLGLGSYLRPDFMLLPVFMVLGLWAYTRRFFKSIAAMALVQVIVLLTLFPWAYRNHSVTGRWIFTSTSVGATLISGLGEFNNPWGFGHTDGHRTREAAAQGFKSPWISEADLYFRELFFKSIKENPGAFLKSILLRLPLVLAPPFESGFANPWKERGFSELQSGGKDRYQVIISRPGYVLAAYFDSLIMSVVSLVCLFSVAVLFIKEWHRWGMVFFLMCPHIYNILTHILIHMEARFLLPTIYCWLIALAYVLTRGWRERHANSSPSLCEVKVAA